MVIMTQFNASSPSFRISPLTVDRITEVISLIDRLQDDLIGFSKVEDFLKYYNSFYKMILLKLIDGEETMDKCIQAKPK